MNLSALAQCYFILGEPEEAIIQDPGRGIQTSDMGDMGCQVAKILKDLLARGEKDLRYVWSLWGVFHSHGGHPVAGWFHRKSQSKIDDEMGYPHFRKPPYV